MGRCLVGFRIAEAFVEVKSDATGLRSEVTRDVEAAGAGQEIKVGLKVDSRPLGGLFANLAPLILPGIAAVTQLTGVLGLVPAVAGAAGLAVGTAAVGFSGFGDAVRKGGADLAALPPEANKAATAVRSLGPAWESLKLDVQQRMFTGLGDIITRVGATDIPVLRTGMGQMADSLNSMFRNIGSWATSTKTVSDLRLIFDNSSVAGANLARSVQPILGLLRDIAAVGSTFLPQLTSHFANAAQKAADFISHARETGQLAGWIQTGITAAGKLWEILKNLVETMIKISQAPGFGPGILDSFVAITGAVLKLVTAIPELVPLIGAAVVAWRAYVIVQAIVNTLMTANPIGLIVVAIGLLVAAVVIAITHWDEFKASMLAVWNAIRSAVTAAINAILSLVTNVWNSITSTTSSTWNSVKNTVTGAINSVRDTVSGVANSIMSTLSNAWNSARNTAVSAWNSIVGAVSSAVGSLMGVVSGVPGRILGALGNLGSLLYQAGVNVIQGLINGIMAMVGRVSSAISSVASTIRGALPFSPAKWGPLSGSGSPDLAGAKIGGMLAEGMHSSVGDVVSASQRMAGAALPRLLPASLSLTAGGSAGGTGGQPSNAGLAKAIDRLGKRMGGVTVNVTQVAGSPAETGRFVALALRTVG